MSSLITVRLYEDDWNPKIGADPKLSAILERTWEKVLDGKIMEDVWDWFYKYKFIEYDSAELYFFFIDWEQYDNINQLDSYWNKHTWWKSGGWVAQVDINTDEIAEKVWSATKKDMKKWTVWEHIFSLHNDNNEIIKELVSISKDISSWFTMMITNTKNLIDWIEFPEWLKIDDIINWVDKIVDWYFNTQKKHTLTSLDYLHKELKSVLFNREKNIIEKMNKLNWEEKRSLKALELQYKRDTISLTKSINLIKDKMIELDKYDIVKISNDKDKEKSKENNKRYEDISKWLNDLEKKMNAFFTRINKQ